MEAREEVHGTMSVRRSGPSLLDSFNYAFEGIIHVLRTQRNMRIHFLVAVGVLVAALATGVSKLELIALLLAIAFVLIAEMINSAIEGAVDVVDDLLRPEREAREGHRRGRRPDRGGERGRGRLPRLRRPGRRPEHAPARPALERAGELTLDRARPDRLVVIAVKALTGRGTPLRGGFPSGHAALAFAGWMAVTLLLDDSDQQFLVSSVTFIMALLVAQTRVESGIHSALEVLYGAALGALITLVLFQVFFE